MQIVIPGLTPNRENVKRDADGNTNLIRAVKNNNMDLVRRFWPVEAGVQNNRGESALMTAIEMNNTDAALMLVERSPGFRMRRAARRSCVPLNGIITRLQSSLRNMSRA